MKLVVNVKVHLARAKVSSLLSIYGNSRRRPFQLYKMFATVDFHAEGWSAETTLVEVVVDVQFPSWIAEPNPEEKGDILS